MKLVNLGLSRLGLSEAAGDFIAGEMRPRRAKFLGFVGLSLVAAVIEMTGVGLIFPLLIVVLSPEYIDKFAPLAWLIDGLGLGRGLGLSVLLIGLVAVLMIGKNAYMVFFYWLQMRTLAHWKTDLSMRLMRMYVFLDYPIHLVKSSSEIIRNIALTTAVYDQFVTGVIMLAVNVTMMAGLAALLVGILPYETMFGMALLGSVALLVYRLMREPFERVGRETNRLYERRQAILRQSIGMVKETRIGAKERFFLEAFGNIEWRNFLEQARYNFMSQIPGLVTEGSVILAILLMVIYILSTSPEAGTGVAILGLLAATMFRMTPLITRSLVALQLMNLSRDAVEILARELAALEPQAFIPAVEPDPLPFEKSIELDRVTFRYPTGSVPALDDVSFAVRKNEIVGVTGASGSGKTTLATVIMGLIAPDKGSVRVDGVELADRLTRRAWQRHVGFVAQSVFLIEDSLGRNIAWGLHDHGIDEARVHEAMGVAQLHEFVASLPKGIHQPIGEDGSRLSGGQRQRLGIARALYEDPGVLVLDEATSALDATTEHAFGEALVRWRRRRTMIVIAHRLSTLRLCDRIVMLEGGRVLDAGTFEELAERCAPFAKLVQHSKLEKAS